MIVEYYRPQSLPEALALLNRPGSPAVPLGGGTWLNRFSLDPLAVVDLQALSLDTVQTRGQVLELGAALSLQAMLGVETLPPALHQAIQLEASYNLRQVATLAGALVTASGRSPLAACLLALDARLSAQPGDEQIELGDFLLTRSDWLPGKLITQVSLPLNARLAYESVARTPADQPLVCVAAARWRSGRTRLALGGFGAAPLMAFDGPEGAGFEAAVENAYFAAADQWASAEYRRVAAVTLARRALSTLD